MVGGQAEEHSLLSSPRELWEVEAGQQEKGRTHQTQL